MNNLKDILIPFAQAEAKKKSHPLSPVLYLLRRSHNDTVIAYRARNGRIVDLARYNSASKASTDYLLFMVEVNRIAVSKRQYREYIRQCDVSFTPDDRPANPELLD